MKKIINFIKYNNAFTLIIFLILFSTAGAFANEKVRDTVIGQTIVKRAGVDNTQIITADLKNFDMGLKINGVKEDVQFYYVNFDYNAIDVKDGVWQTIKKEKNMSVSKTRLGNMDLGLYLAEELKQLTDQEMAYMKEVQNIEKNKGLKKQTESVEYTGLKGLVFNNETRELTGYKPVKEEEKNKTVIIDAAALTIKSVENKEENKKTDKEEVVQQITVVKEMVSKETIMQMVKEAIAQEQSGSASSGSPSSSAPTSVSGGSARSSSESSSVSSVASPPTGEAGSSSSESSSVESSSSSSESSLPAAGASSSSESISTGSSSSVSSESSSSSAESASSSSAESSFSSEATSLPASEASSSSVAI